MVVSFSLPSILILAVSFLSFFFILSLDRTSSNLAAARLTGSTHSKGSLGDERNPTSKYYRNKRAVQGGRLSAITMALQYGSESEEDAALAGRH